MNENYFKIRKAGVDDLSSILDVLSQLSPTDGYRKTLKDILEEIINDYKYVLLVATVDKKVVATGMLVVRLNLSHGGKNVAYIENIVVDKEHRRKGIGEAIVAKLISNSRKLDCYKIVLDCSVDAFHFYRKCGFAKTDENNMRMNLK